MNTKNSLNWYQLWQQIGKQPLCRTRDRKVQILINGELKECLLVFTNNGSDFYLDTVEAVKNTTDDLVVITTENVKHGHWKLLDECCNAGIYCSICGKKVFKTYYANQKIKSKYCPNCGSIMDGEFERWSEC